MRRREFVALAGAAAALPFAARAQPSKRVPRIGLLLPGLRTPILDEFLGGLRDLGWIDGETVHADYRFAEGDDARLPALAAELVGENVDILVTSASGVYPARRASSTIPIVVIVAPDLGAFGVASLSHPGGNLTGQTFFLPQLVAKRLEILKTIMPSLSRAGVVMYRGSGANADVMRVASVAAAGLKLELRPIELASLDELESAFPPPSSEAIGGFVTTDHTLFQTNDDILSAMAKKRGLAWIGAPLSATHGGLLGYGVDFAALYRHAAVFADKILKGAKPGDIPIEEATKFKTIVNLKTAKALGLDIPPNVLASADEVIE
jgi:putative ABC transport system substrate-binding protein